MENYYEEILEIKGAQELHQLVAKWENLAANLERRTYGAPIVLPDIILYTAHGFGNSRLLALLAEYLDEKKVLMDFSGDVKLLEFAMNYCPSDQPFEELTRLMDSIRAAAGYHNDFKGVLRIALDRWVGHHSEKYFLELMEFLSAHTNDWMIVLSISKKPDEKTRNLEAIVSMFLRTEVIHMQLPDVQDLAAYANSYMQQFGLRLDASALDVLTKSLEKLSSSKYYHSYRSVELLCNDIVYTVMSQAQTPMTVLSAADVKDFSQDSAYIKKTETESAKRIVLGFRPE